jgi:hypothetical protein
MDDAAICPQHIAKKLRFARTQFTGPAFASEPGAFLSAREVAPPVNHGPGLGWAERVEPAFLFCHRDRVSEKASDGANH